MPIPLVPTVSCRLVASSSSAWRVGRLVTGRPLYHSSKPRQEGSFVDVYGMNNWSLCLDLLGIPFLICSLTPAASTRLAAVDAGEYRGAGQQRAAPRSSASQTHIPLRQTQKRDIPPRKSCHHIMNGGVAARKRFTQTK